jgi:hypothetical protein
VSSESIITAGQYRREWVQRRDLQLGIFIWVDHDVVVIRVDAAFIC